MDVNDKLWDYTICLENAIRSLNNKCNNNRALANEWESREIEILSRVERDLKRIIDDINYKTYWDYLDTEEEE